jgi:hypothetical protein
MDLPRFRAPPARRAFCRPDCAARCTPATAPPRRLCRTVAHCLEPRAAGSPSHLSPGNASPSRGSACVSVLVCSGMSSGPSPVSCTRKSRWPSYRGIEAGVPSPRLPITVAHRPKSHRPQHTLAVRPVRSRGPPSSSSFRRSPALSLSTAPSIAPEQKLLKNQMATREVGSE